MAVPTAIATSPPGTPPKRTPPNQPHRMMAKHTRPITGVLKIWLAGLMAMKVMEMPASEPSRAARGVMRRITGRDEAARHQHEALDADPGRGPACHACTGSCVRSWIGSMMTKVTMNMCGTLMPDGSAHTSLRPVRLASRQPSHA